MTDLPINAILNDLVATFRTETRAVLQAPPGAGKTTVVPLALLKANLGQGRIIMLEPRRLAARAAAERMAETLGETVGETVGYRMRGDSKTSKATRIEVVTEGILTRMLQSNPELSGIDIVIFDEFHERSLNADLGLALCLEISEALRDDLRVLVMSATLDAEPVAQLMNAPILTSEGRSFEVTPIWLDRPLPPKTRLEHSLSDLILTAADQTQGSMLVFLPGQGEISRVDKALSGRLPKDWSVHPLFGAMDFAKQRAALAPAKEGRKIVLATSIAETSLTIPDVTTVVDAGLARRARFDAGTGMARLVTEKVSQAEATQRMGRAGRVQAGKCFKLWSRAEEGTLPRFAPAEIQIADLTGLVLELTAWGADPEDLKFLTMPPTGQWKEARNLLETLGLMTGKGRLTTIGEEAAKLPLHPRLANMLIRAGEQAAPLAALLSEADPLDRSAPVDIALRLEAIRDLKSFIDRRPYRINRASHAKIKEEARRLSKLAKSQDKLSPAQMLALAYPDRIGQRRKGDEGRYVLSGGKGAILPQGDEMQSAMYIVAPSLDGNPREAKVRLALAITQPEIRGVFEDEIHWVNTCEWSKRERRVVARKQERLGAIVLNDQIWKDAPSEEIARAMLDGVRDLGLPISDAARRFIARVALGNDLPDMSEAALMESLEDWLWPYLDGVKSAQDLRAFDILPALRARLDWDQMQRLDTAVPAHFSTPLGRNIPIDYSGEAPEISLRLQEMFGQTAHPMVGNTPLRVTLLSPAGRPVQTTMDIPGFWATSYADVRKDMRGRYPKHPWPEDPTVADPTLRAKPRK